MTAPRTAVHASLALGMILLAGLAAHAPPALAQFTTSVEFLPLPFTATPGDIIPVCWRGTGNTAQATSLHFDFVSRAGSTSSIGYLGGTRAPDSDAGGPYALPRVFCASFTMPDSPLYLRARIDAEATRLSSEAHIAPNSGGGITISPTRIATDQATLVSVTIAGAGAGRSVRLCSRALSAFPEPPPATLTSADESRCPAVGSTSAEGNVGLVVAPTQSHRIYVYLDGALQTRAIHSTHGSLHVTQAPGEPLDTESIELGISTSTGAGVASAWLLLFRGDPATLLTGFQVDPRGKATTRLATGPHRIVGFHPGYDAGEATMRVDAAASVPALSWRAVTVPVTGSTGWPVPIKADLVNAGGTDRTVDVEFLVNGALVSTHSGSLPAHSRLPMDFAFTPSRGGTHEIGLRVAAVPFANVTRFVLVAEPARASMLDVSPPAFANDVPVGRPVTVQANVTNTGAEAMTAHLVLRINNTFRDANTFPLAAGERTLAAFTFTPTIPGRYEIDILEEGGVSPGSRTLRVWAPPETPTPPAPTPHVDPPPPATPTVPTQDPAPPAPNARGVAGATAFLLARRDDAFVPRYVVSTDERGALPVAPEPGDLVAVLDPRGMQFAPLSEDGRLGLDAATAERLAKLTREERASLNRSFRDLLPLAPRDGVADVAGVPGARSLSGLAGSESRLTRFDRNPFPGDAALSDADSFFALNSNKPGSAELALDALPPGVLDARVKRLDPDTKRWTDVPIDTRADGTRSATIDTNGIYAIQFDREGVGAPLPVPWTLLLGGIGILLFLALAIGMFVHDRRRKRRRTPIREW